MALDYRPTVYRDNALRHLSQRLAKHGLSPMTCFISYCWSETIKPFAAQLRDDLSKAGIDVIFDMTHNQGGTYITGDAGFIQKVRTADRVVVCCTPDLKARYGKREGVVSDELDLIIGRLNQATQIGASSSESNTYVGDIFPIWCEADLFEQAVPEGLRGPVCLNFSGKEANGTNRPYELALWELLKALYRTGQQPHLIPAFDLTWQEWQAQLAKGEQPVSYWAAENFPQHMDDWVERGAEVALLKQAFDSGKVSSSTAKTSSRRVLCTGAGGVGKTVLAIHYAYECGAYQSIIWLRGETRETYLEDWVAYGKAHQLTRAEQTTPLAQAKAITKSLSEKTGYLVVIDNVDTEAVADAVGQTLPTHGGDVLITGRYKNIANLSQTIDIESMRAAEGCELLRQFVPEAETETLKALGEAVGYLPLALSQVGAYLKATGTSPKAYLAEFKTEKARSEAILSEDNLPKGHGARETLIVGLIWEKTFEALKAQLPKEKYEASMGLLLSCSYLSGDGISKALLVEWLEERGMGRVASESGLSLRALHGLLKPLIEYNLIQVNEEAIQMHRLLQAVVQEKGAGELRHGPSLRDWLAFFTKRLKKRDNTTSGIVRRKSYAAQLPVLANQAEAFWEGGARNRDFLRVYEDFLWEQKKLYFDLEEADGQRIVGERLKGLYETEPDSVKMSEALSILAGAHWSLGHPIEAKTLYERALALQVRHYGRDHVALTVTLMNLGNVHSTLGQMIQAKTLYERALAIQARYYGRDYVELSATLMNLGAANYALGHPLEAKTLYEQALAIQARHYGQDHVELAATLVCLGAAYLTLGDTIEAKTLYERALALQERHYGPGHIELALTLMNLGAAHHALWDTIEAKPLYERALALQERHYGPGHVALAATLMNLGNALDDLGETVQAKSLLERALAIQVRHYGRDHVELAVTLMNLGIVHRTLGDTIEAKTLYERALAIQVRHYGRDHVELALTLMNLGAAYHALGDTIQAKTLYDRALSLQVRHYGEEHPELLITLVNLIGACLDLKENDEALQHRLRLEAIYDTSPYADKPDLPISRHIQIQKKRIDAIKTTESERAGGSFFENERNQNREGSGDKQRCVM